MNGAIEKHHSFLCNESGNEVNENHSHYRVELDKGNAKTIRLDPLYYHEIPAQWVTPLQTVFQRIEKGEP